MNDEAARLIAASLESIATSIDGLSDAIRDKGFEIGVESPQISDAIKDLADAVNSIGE